MLDIVLKSNTLLLQYARMLLADIPDERLTEQPLPGVNHPAWILGHLALSTEMTLTSLGAAKTLPPDWAGKFGPGSKLSAARGDYPAREELLRAFEEGFARVRQRAAAATPEQLARPSTNAGMKEFLPTVGDGVVFALTGHLAGHLGQLSAWRRMIGVPPLF